MSVRPPWALQGGWLVKSKSRCPRRPKKKLALLNVGKGGCADDPIGV